MQQQGFNGQQNQQQMPVQMQQAQVQEATPGTSGMATAGFVLSLIALLLSFIPIINNAAFFMAVVGVILSIVSKGAISKGKATGKGLATTGIVLGIFALIITLAMQAACSAALDGATNGAKVDSVNASGSASANSAASASTTTDLQVGSSANLSDGLSVSVTAVMPGLKDYDGDIVTGITVTYVNNGNKEVSFNTYNWKGQDAQGAQRTSTIYFKSENALNSGTLAPGGTVTGNVYFDGSINKVLYYSSALSNKSTVSWVL